MTKAQKAEQKEAITQLRKWIKPGDTVYTILDHVSRSGMSRNIRVLLPTVELPTDEALAREYLQAHARIDFLHPNRAVATALGWRQAKRGDGIVVGGCGMNMGFHLVYELSYVLYGSGYQCLGKGKCPSNYHMNHRDTIRCEGTGDRRCDGPSMFSRFEVPEGWPRKQIDIGDGETVDGGLLACYTDSGEDGKPYDVCKTCKGEGRLPNPEGPERWDLVHTDGYALRHKWL